MTAGPSGVLSGLCLSTLGDFLPTPGALLLTPQNQTKLGKSGACSRGRGSRVKQQDAEGREAWGAEEWLGQRKRKECAEVTSSKCVIRSHARTCQRGGVVGCLLGAGCKATAKRAGGPWRGGPLAEPCARTGSLGSWVLP